MPSSQTAKDEFWSLSGELTLPASQVVPNIGVLFSRLEQLVKAGRIEQALALAERAVQKSDNADTRSALAGVCLVAGDVKRAEANYTEALCSRPEHFVALLGLGQLRLNNGDATQAIALLETALRIVPQDVNARHLLARSLAMKQRFAEALNLFTSLVAEVPDNAEIWCGYARALATVGKTNEAVLAYKKAAELDPNSAVIQ
jgi:tetratricopeptide (TPR) repeat protein